MTERRPPFDPELAIALSQIPPSIASRDMIPAMRAGINQIATADVIAQAYPSVIHEERKIPGPNGDVPIHIFRPKDGPSGAHPGIYWIHAGGMIAGNPFTGMQTVGEWVELYNAVCISVDYRLAPEHMAPIPVEDCYAGLKWVGNNLEVLGIEAGKLMIGGQSAGGGLAAGVSLLVRDRGGPSLCAQLLMCPMLDDRGETVSQRQFHVVPSTWSGETNAMAWDCLLGKHDAGDSISFYSVPARAEDLSELPTAYIDVGSAEAFRDEGVAYASRLWAAGVQAELHVWPGAFHASDAFLPTAVISQIANKTRTAWVGRVLSKA